jgi:hypothetical protein
MAEALQCLVIVPRDEPELCTRLAAVFANDPRIVVRLDGRTTRAPVDHAAVFPVGHGELAAGLRAYVEDELRQVTRGSR